MRYFAGYIGCAGILLLLMGLVFRAFVLPTIRPRKKHILEWLVIAAFGFGMYNSMATKPGSGDSSPGPRRSPQQQTPASPHEHGLAFGRIEKSPTNVLPTTAWPFGFFDYAPTFGLFIAKPQPNGVPSPFELYHGTNPYVPDAHLIQTPDCTNTDFTTLKSALANSTEYSIINLPTGTIDATDTILMPPHPVLLSGPKDGYTVIESTGGKGAFRFEDGQEFSYPDQERLPQPAQTRQFPDRFLERRQSAVGRYRRFTVL